MSKLRPDPTLQNVNFRISDDELSRLDRLATRAGLTRSQFIRNLIITGLEEVEAWEKVGLVPVALTVRDIANWMAEKSRQITESPSSLAEKKA